MKTLPPPAWTALQSYSTCISKVKNASLKARLTSLTQTIVNASIFFNDSAIQQKLHLVAHGQIAGGVVTNLEMQNVYNYRMAAKGSIGRHIYDELYSASPHGRCPLCDFGQVKTLDHHLPKAHYPALVVTPLNLVPSCTDCNKAKHHRIPQQAVDVSLHPYYDDIDGQRWLSADLIQTNPMALRYRALPHAGWNVTLQQRVINHFRNLGLAQLYSTLAAEELLDIRGELRDVFRLGGVQSVQTHLSDRASSIRANRLNGWRTIAYEVWAASNWFCNQGFN